MGQSFDENDNVLNAVTGENPEDVMKKILNLNDDAERINIAMIKNDDRFVIKGLQFKVTKVLNEKGKIEAKLTGLNDHNYTKLETDSKEK